VSFKIQTNDDNPLNGFALCIVGKGKLFHLSPANDDSLCPASVRSNGIREYVDSERINERDICSRCYKAAEKHHKLAYAAHAAETQDDVMSQVENLWHVMVDGEWILTEWKNAGQPVTAWVGDKLKNVEFCHFATSNVGSCTLCTDHAPMEDTMDMPLVVSAILRIDIDGVSIPLGCHTFTIPFGNEKSIPTLYGEMHGEWKRPGEPDWDSLITVVESETY
jgi:hypothetical protein